MKAHFISPLSELSASVRFGEVTVFLHQRFTDQDRIRPIDLKDLNGGPARRGQPDQLGCLPGKMFGPAVAAGMKQANHLAGDRVNPGKIRPFVFVAAQARPSQVGGKPRPAMLLGNDVIHLKPQGTGNTHNKNQRAVAPLP